MLNHESKNVKASYLSSQQYVKKLLCIKRIYDIHELKYIPTSQADLDVVLTGLHSIYRGSPYFKYEQLFS